MTIVIMALLGGVVGGVVLTSGGGFVFGLAVGAVAGWVSDLAGRVRTLERRLEAQKTAGEAPRQAEPPVPQRAREPAAEAPPPVPHAAPLHEPIPMPPTARESTPESAPAFEREAAAAARPPVAAPPPEPALASTGDAAREPRRAVLANVEPTAIERLFKRALRWFTTGNVPVKVGVVLSLFGVGFLVKEGIDRQWVVLPIELQLMLVALFGIGLLTLGWRLRQRNRTYALSVQGGGIGVLYLTIFASFSLYGLLPAALAFALLVGVTAAAGALAVLQDARALAVLGILGGFLAPVLVSTGSGNHVALFGYYAVLDLAILGIAWFKAWRVLNVLGFLFTFGIGTLWGIDGYTPDKFATTEPFLILFTLMYLVIPVLFATRVETKLRGFVDGTLTFGTPIVAFTLQSQLVADTEYGLAISAVVLALYYVGMGTWLFRTQRENLRVLVEAQLALAVAFVTVAVPLALDARWTSAAWALQGAALVWLAYRQHRPLALLAGLVLQVLSGYEYAEQPSVTAEWPILNGYFLGALMLALAGFFSARLLDPARERRAENPPVPAGIGKAASILVLLWASAWWFVGGVTEIARSVSDNEVAWLLGFASVTAVFASALAARIDWPRLDWLGLTLWPVAALLVMVSLIEYSHPAVELGWLAWPAVLGSMLWFLRAREARFPRLDAVLHVAAFWLAAGLAAWEAHWLVDRVADGVWPEAAVLALGAALVLAALRASESVAWPFAAHARAYALFGCGAVLAMLAVATFGLNVASPGEAAPLAYVPLLNPLELASALVLLALLRWLGAIGQHNRALDAAPARPAVAGLAAWFLVTMIVARSVHHWAQVPYDVESLAQSTTFQSALSIVWGVAGLAAMIIGARGARRGVWLVGAGLMGIVVVKLFVVDLGNTATLARVVSFLGVGLLLLVVGYFAPVPPRAAAEARAA
jgi:uncharacterized membrane protein